MVDFALAFSGAAISMGDMSIIKLQAQRAVAHTTSLLEGILSASNAVRPSIAQRAANPEIAAARDRLDALIVAARAWFEAAGDLLLAVDATAEEMERAKACEREAAHAYGEVERSL
jgi:hypothetical protein